MLSVCDGGFEVTAKLICLQLLRLLSSMAPVVQCGGPPGRCDDSLPSVDCDPPQCTDEIPDIADLNEAGSDLVASMAAYLKAVCNGNKMGESKYRLEADKPNGPLDVMDCLNRRCLDLYRHWDLDIGSTRLGLTRAYSMRVTSIYQ